MSKHDFTAAEFAERLGRVRAAMMKAGIDWLVAIHPVSLHWLTGSDAKSYQEFQCLLIGAADQPLVALVRAAGKTAMPHSPYFGPGYAATLQLAALQADPGLFEFLYVTPEAWLDPALARPRDGLLDVPSAPGLGFTPDPALLRRFQAH